MRLAHQRQDIIAIAMNVRVAYSEKYGRMVVVNAPVVVNQNGIILRRSVYLAMRLPSVQTRITSIESDPYGILLRSIVFLAPVVNPIGMALIAFLAQGKEEVCIL